MQGLSITIGSDRLPLAVSISARMAWLIAADPVAYPSRDLLDDLLRTLEGCDQNVVALAAKRTTRR
jgi:hypothetical protein